MVPLFDDLAILENEYPVVDISRHIKKVWEKVTYKSALAIVYNKRGMSDAVF